jgi:hypothetical protein
MIVSVSETIANNVLNIFDSTQIAGNGKDAKFDPDLGAPNKACPGGGPGRGRGGKPTSPFPNCEPQGNLLIIQNESIAPTTPNDSPYGGKIRFAFTKKVTLLDLGIIDIDEEDSVEVTVTAEGRADFPFNSPDNIGNNGFWKAKETQGQIIPFPNVVVMEVFLPGSGGISYIKINVCDD